MLLTLRLLLNLKHEFIIYMCLRIGSGDYDVFSVVSLLVFTPMHSLFERSGAQGSRLRRIPTPLF